MSGGDPHRLAKIESLASRAEIAAFRDQMRAMGLRLSGEELVALHRRQREVEA